MADTVHDLALAVAPKPRLVVLTGAGISAECGLQPYRGPGGRYEDDEAARLVTAEALAEERPVVLRHFAGWRDAAQSASPGPAHGALVRLGKALGRRMTLVTQNVDTLHERAGSRGVLSMHGDLDSVRCEARRPHLLPWRGDIDAGSRCQARTLTGRRCGAPLRPAVVLFGEPILHGATIGRALTRASAYFAIGTSGVVTPAATFVLQARLAGATTALFNLTPPGAEAHNEWAQLAAAAYDYVILGKASETVPAAVDALLDACGLEG